MCVTHACAVVQGEQILKDGIGTASEVEEVVQDVTTARSWLSDPSAMLQYPSHIIQDLAKQYQLSQLNCLGGFKNLRKEYSWEGYTLELDETQYDWGTVYELECETDHPEQLRNQLETLLGDNGVQYKYSTRSKFANFIQQTLE